MLMLMKMLMRRRSRMIEIEIGVESGEELSKRKRIVFQEEGGELSLK